MLNSRRKACRPQGLARLSISLARARALSLSLSIGIQRTLELRCDWLSCTLNYFVGKTARRREGGGGDGGSI